MLTLTITEADWGRTSESPQLSALAQQGPVPQRRVCRKRTRLGLHEALVHPGVRLGGAAGLAATSRPPPAEVRRPLNRPSVGELTGRELVFTVKYMLSVIFTHETQYYWQTKFSNVFFLRVTF